jgi:hypothetical protein
VVQGADKQPLFCVDPDDYATLARNEVEAERYILDLRSVLQYYRSIK